MNRVNEIFHIGQKIKFKKKYTQESGRNGGRTVGIKEECLTIIGLYKHFALCQVKGSRTTYSYWDLERALRGEVIE